MVWNAVVCKSLESLLIPLYFAGKHAHIWMEIQYKSIIMSLKVSVWYDHLYSSTLPKFSFNFFKQSSSSPGFFKDNRSSSLDFCCLLFHQDDVFLCLYCIDSAFWIFVMLTNTVIAKSDSFQMVSAFLIPPVPSILTTSPTSLGKTQPQTDPNIHTYMMI